MRVKSFKPWHRPVPRYCGVRGGYSDIDTMWKQVNKSLDTKEREELLMQIQKKLYVRRVFIYLLRSGSPAAVSTRVKGNPWQIVEPVPIFFAAPMEDYALNE